MYKSSLPPKKEILVHLGFWAIWLYYSLIMVQSDGLHMVETDLFYNTGMIVYVITFYANYLLVLPRVFRPFRWAKAAVGYLAVFLFYGSLRYLVEQVMTVHLFGQRNYFGDISIVYYFYDNLFYSSKPIILSTVLWAVVFLIRTLDYNNYITQEQKNTEIKFLKAQINPHFVFNTLNNIYSMVYFQSPKSLQAIEKLGQIMRFTTYEAPRNRIRLGEEINYIKAYIELEELRHTETGFVKLDINVSDENTEIPPYMLSPLVENALKHGTFNAQNPIYINLFCDGRMLRMETRNEIGKQKKDKLGGIGLDNLQRRLEILYPKKYRLHTFAENNHFFAELEITLA